ncbi:hypothetical protein BJX99DRAFT_226318 [Aspergillus californicus]
MASKYTYSYFRISKTSGITASAQKYRDLRLQALKTSPGSFSSTYEIESAFTEADWISRLTVPDREVFICAATPSSDSDPATTQWIGQVTLRGPASATDFTLPPDANQPPQRPDTEEERWQMLSLFTLPDHRGHGLGSKLCQASLDYLRDYKSDPKGVQVRLIVKKGNDVTIELYRRLGFADAGRATLVEALIANGDEELIPDDADRGSAMFVERQGVIMVLRLERG